MPGVVAMIVDGLDWCKEGVTSLYDILLPIQHAHPKPCDLGEQALLQPAKTATA